MKKKKVKLRLQKGGAGMKYMIEIMMWEDLSDQVNSLAIKKEGKR